MSDIVSAKEVESTQVQLTRIEGSINMVDYKVTNMITQVDTMKADISKLQTDVHTLQIEAVSREATAKTVASTLKEKNEEDQQHSEQKWSPYQKAITILMGCSSVGLFLVALLK